MSARYLSVAMVLALAALPASADTAKARGSSSEERSVGARHHSVSAVRQAPPPTAVQRETGPAPSAVTGAQSRHPRAGTGHGFQFPSYRGYYPYRYYPYRSYYGFGGFPYFDFHYGYGAYGWPYYYGGPYSGGPYNGGYYGGRYRYAGDYGSVRVLVDPNETRVYVDGSYAGTADDFDGLFQRLHVPPGRHDLAFKLEGFRTHRMRVYVPYDGTLKIHHDMVQGEGNESFEDLAGDRGLDEPRAEARMRGERRDYRDDSEDDYPERRPAREERAGTLRLDVRPDGASIYVDGMFRGTGRSLQRLELPAGTHRIEILHPGMRPFERDVTVEAGESEELEIELTR